LATKIVQNCEPIDNENSNTFYPKKVTKLSKIWVGDLRSGKKPVPDPGSRGGVKKAPNPGSGSTRPLERMYK
jgi:hypothetical protein